MDSGSLLFSVRGVCPLIADVLRVRGIEVAHILDAEHCVPHPYTSPARIVEGRLSYSQSP
jgi:hypothetical protein